MGWRPDASHLDGLVDAAIAVALDGRVTYCNDSAVLAFGYTRDDLVGQDLRAVLFEPESHGAVEEISAQVRAGATWVGQLEVRSADGKVRHTRVSQSPLWDGDALAGLLLVIDVSWGTTGARRAKQLSNRLTRLARVASELVVAEDVETVTKVVTSHAADAVGATVASLSLVVDENTLELVGIRGGRDGVASRWATYSIHSDTPAAEAVRTGQRVVLIGQDAIHDRYPDLESAAPGERALICLPLCVATRCVGVISLSFPGRRRVDGAELEFLGILADNCAQALDRMQAASDARDRARKLRFLADSSVELASSMDYETTLSNVARLVVPAFADWCAVDLVADGKLHRLAVAHIDPSKVALAEELHRRYPPDPSSPQGPWHVLRTGESQLVPEITEEMLRTVVTDPEQLRALLALGLRSALIVPLTIRGRILGVVTWVWGEEGGRYTEADRSFAEDLGRRMAAAIDNAQLYSETRDIAVRLQHAVLPASLPAMPGWDLATHYSPAGRTDVGGDFFDVVPLDDARVALFIGDVMGRGLAAAAAMAHMRSAVRAYLAVDPSPQVVLDRLDMMFARWEVAQLVTLIYAVADAHRDTMDVANAGHIPPVILRGDRSVQQLPAPTSAPLGVEAGNREVLTVPFKVGDTFLACTDGLIERMDEDIDVGQARLVAAVPNLVGNLTGGLDVLVSDVLDRTRQDDVAVLAVRRTGAGRATDPAGALLG